MKICQYAFGGHSKDREAGASGEGDPQTNAFTSEGIKPWALKVRVGLNCAALLKIQQKHLFFPPGCSRCLRLDHVYVGEGGGKKCGCFSFEVVYKRHLSLLLRCKYLYQIGESPCQCHGIVWKI